jgi:tripartite-type tricarboxylate transporter receptor subunit TctC
MKRRPFVRSMSGLLFGAMGSWTVSKASTAYPMRPVRMIVPLAPGGGSDAIARLISQHLTERYGQSFVVENRPGASGILGTDLVAKAPADGYTLLTVFSTHAMSAELFKKLPYDPVKDFVPVSLAVQSPLVLLVNPTLPIHSFKDFVDYAKANPGKLNYGSSGQGSAPQLMTEQLNAMAGIKTTHVPYKGVAPITLALLQNEIQFALANIFTTLPMVKSGKLRMIATGGLKRSLLAPDVPTIAESGLSGYDAVVWYGFLAPAKTPPDVVDELSRAIAATLRKPDVVKTIVEGGNEPVGSTPQEFARIMSEEAKKWGTLGRKLGIELD